MDVSEIFACWGMLGHSILLAANYLKIKFSHDNKILTRYHQIENSRLLEGKRKTALKKGKINSYVVKY